MEMLILGFIAGGMLTAILLSFTTISKINEYEEENQTLYKEKKELQEENEELKVIRSNAESRATQHTRKLKQIENILLQKGHGTIVDRFDKIKEVIVGQNK